MRQLAALAALAVAALVVQGAGAALLPAAVVPDLTLLVAVTGAVVFHPVPGLLLAAGVGYGADLLSGSLLGAHALLRVLVFAATLVMAGQFQLARGLPITICVAGLTVVDAVLLGVLGSVFQGLPFLGVAALAPIATRAVATALLAPWALGVVSHLRERWLEGEARREVRLETRRPVL